MSSVVFIHPIGRSCQIRFHQPVKGVIGKVLCGTDGSIGYTTEFVPALALLIVNHCEQWKDLSVRDRRRLRMLRHWAERGYGLMAYWVH